MARFPISIKTLIPRSRNPRHDLVVERSAAYFQKSGFPRDAGWETDSHVIFNCLTCTGKQAVLKVDGGSCRQAWEELGEAQEVQACRARS
jgi:hypothetical protein